MVALEEKSGDYHNDYNLPWGEGWICLPNFNGSPFSSCWDISHETICQPHGGHQSQ